MSKSSWEFHMRNCDPPGYERMFAVCHAGCGGDLHRGRSKCWDVTLAQNTGGGDHSVYRPSNWVVQFDDWFAVTIDGIKLAIDVANIASDEGDPAKLAVDIAKTVGQVLNTSEDVAKAAIDNHNLDPKALLNKLDQNFAEACTAVGCSQDRVRKFAGHMGLGSNWGLIAGSTYKENIIEDNEKTNGGSGWTVVSGPTSALESYDHYATSAFVWNGRLVYRWHGTDNYKFWEKY